MKLSTHSKQIAASFIVVLSLSSAMILFDLSRINGMQEKLNIITQAHSVKSALMMVMRHGIYERQVSLRDILLLDDTFEKDEKKNVFNRHALHVLEARNKFSEMALSKKEKDVLREINVAMVVAYKAQLDIIDKSIFDEGLKFSEEEIQGTLVTQKILMSKVTKMVSLQEKATKQAVNDAEESYSEAITSIYLLGGSSIIFGLFVAVFIIRLSESQERDVKNAIVELEKSHNTLEARVRLRTEELADARDAALASNKAKDDFLATMSHELRTPLNIIIGYSEMLEEIARENNAKGFIPDIKKIQSAAAHQLKLVSSILDISKIEDGKLDINLGEFDIEAFIMDLEAAARPLVSENKNIFIIECKPGIGMMNSDSLRIHQILLNLLGNAAKFTHNGKITLNVTKNSEDKVIIFKVIDNGVGIKESYMEHLFDKFTQEDSSTTRKYGGSGLGLTISKELSKQLNGNLTANSKEGEGSCFTLTLPTTYKK